MGSNDRLLNPVHLFRAYARKLATESSFPVIRRYHETRYRLISGLFGFDLEHDEGLRDLAECHNRLSFFHPCGSVVLGSNGIDGLEGFPSAVRGLRRHAAAMRRLYVGLALEKMREESSGVSGRRVSTRRLAQLTAFGKPPDATDECIKFLENEEESPVDDDVSPAAMDALKRREEDEIRAGQILRREMDLVITRSLAAGLGTPETVRQHLYDMEVGAFLRLAEGCPHLSRVDFKPCPAK